MHHPNQQTHQQDEQNGEGHGQMGEYEQVSDDDTTEGDERAWRLVNAARQDDKGFTDAEDAKEGGFAGDDLPVFSAAEGRIAPDGKGNQHHQSDQQGGFLKEAPLHSDPSIG